ncbi:hypothetical protein PMIT1303_00004 [Prochlorococcus sp. MIT 1303]|nr:hypothetical protein PMIT1303_00004 [Prochlorococcus sp. MIT 1303]
MLKYFVRQIIMRVKDIQDLKTFYFSIVNSSAMCLKNNNFTDNWDSNRFGVRDPGYNKNFAYELNEFTGSIKELFQVFRMLSDEYSKELFFSYLCYRMVGHTAVKISSDWEKRIAATTSFNQVAQNSKTESVLNMLDYNGNKLNHYDFIWESTRYLIDCINLTHILGMGQYYYDRNNIRIAPETGDYIIDGGAFLGDTACIFSNSVGEKGKVYAFDPLDGHCDVIRHNFNQLDIDNCVLFQYGLSNTTNIEDLAALPKIRIDQCAPGFSLANNPKISLPLVSLDHLLAKGDIERIDFIKLDIEGSELNALKGATEVIQKFKPKLAISLYHKPNDLHEIPLYISSNFSFYSLYIDHYTIHQEELVLYCMPNLEKD